MKNANRTILLKEVKTLRTITVSAFRSDWMGVFNNVAATGEPVLITKRGKPFIQLQFAGYQPASENFQGASKMIPCIGISSPK
jgi:prevent-host-death family protein